MERTLAYETITVEQRDAVTLITLNRPKALNALNSTILAELTEAFAAYEADKSQLCAVLTGSGDKAFAAGADIKEMSEKAAADFYLEDFFSPWTSLFWAGEGFFFLLGGKSGCLVDMCGVVRISIAIMVT